MAEMTEAKLKELMMREVEKIANDARGVMKSLAPHPTGRPRGKGSMSTGALAMHIIVEKVSDGYKVGVDDRQIDYAKFAEEGRGAISKKYKMRFRGADGRIHYATKVAGMEGWHFVEGTAKIIEARYG